MTRKILVFLIAALFFVLTGLLVLYFYLRHSGIYDSQALRYIPVQTTAIIRVQQTSENLNELLENDVIKDNFPWDNLFSGWSIVDSLTSRNYKTSEILHSTTSYFCLDSVGKWIVLVEVPANTSEHFIDQFLVNSTRKKKLDKYKEGYKSVHTGKKNLYYFLRENIFGVSYEKELISQSLHAAEEPGLRKEWTEWNTDNKAEIAIWARNTGSIESWQHAFIPPELMGNWIDSLGGYSSFTVSWKKGSLILEGDIYPDSANSFAARFWMGKTGKDLGVYVADSLEWKHEYYSLQYPDSQGVNMPFQAGYLGFPDSLGYVEMLVSESPVASMVINRVFADSTVQIVPMADASIGKVVVIQGKVLKDLMPVFPFDSDTGSFFGARIKGAVFFTRSMESVLKLATIYPQSPFKKLNVPQSTVISSMHKVRVGNRVFVFHYVYTSSDGKKFHMSADVKCDNCK